MPSIDSGQNGSSSVAAVLHSPPIAGRVSSDWTVATPRTTDSTTIMERARRVVPVACVRHIAASRQNTPSWKNTPQRSTRKLPVVEAAAPSTTKATP